MQRECDRATRTRKTPALAVLGSTLMLALGACAKGSSGTPSVGLEPEGMEDDTLPRPEGASEQDDEAEPSPGRTPTNARDPGANTNTGAATQGAGTTGPRGGTSANPVTSTSMVTPATPSCPAPNWSAVAPLSEQPAPQNVRSLRATTQGECLYVLVEFANADASYALLLDTDANGATGYQPLKWSERSGADYLVQAGQLYRYDSTGGQATAWKWRDPKPLQPIATERSLEFRIPLSLLQSKGPLSLAFMLIKPDNESSGEIPSGKSFVALSPSPQTTAGPDPRGDRSACLTSVPNTVSSARRPIAASQGMIVPAYLPVTGVRTDKWDLLRFLNWPKPVLLHGRWQVEAEGTALFELTNEEYEWLRLARAAREMSAQGLDFWVVVSGPNSGPLTSPADLPIASRVWGDIREQGGRIFGYVHTCKRPGETAEFIAIDEVTKQIKTWVTHYNDLDGIWLDEFYPRYELFDVDSAGVRAPAACNAEVMPPSYPNGACSSPVDRGFLLANGCYNPAVQINPEGGYYHTLTGRIRAEFPWLRIIGNAGGRLYSNQLSYAKLVDVLVSYENSFAHAQQNWSNLKRQDANVKYEAALFHSTDLADMPSAIEHVLDYGYTHVYTTDQLHSSGGNVWGKVSGHLANETTYLIEQH